MTKKRAYDKKDARVKKISKEADDSGPVAGCVRVAPTLIAVPTRGAWGRVLTMRPLNTYTLLHPTPRIYKYNQYFNERFNNNLNIIEKFWISNSKITLFHQKFKIRNFNLYKIFWKHKRIYEFWNSRLSLPHSPVMKNK